MIVARFRRILRDGIATTLGNDASCAWDDDLDLTVEQTQTTSLLGVLEDTPHSLLFSEPAIVLVAHNDVSLNLGFAFRIDPRLNDSSCCD
jgi:hypothetical protein